MKKFAYYIMIAFLLGGSVHFSSCSDKEKTLSEWDLSYVSLLPVDYLRPTPSFTLKHIEGKGIEGSVSFPVVATIQKPAKEDIKVQIDAVCDGISADKIIKSSDVALIKAGDFKSDTVTVSISDWSDIESVKDAAEYTLNINIAGFLSSDQNITKSEFNQSVEIKINKEQAKMEQFLFFGKAPENSTLHSNVTDWSFSFMEGVENPNSNSVAGTGSSDVATDGTPFWIIIDFKDTKEVTGLQTSHWGPSYSPKKVEILVSDNGSSWRSLGEVETSGSTQTIAFKNTVETRYVKYQMVNVPGRVDIIQLRVYMAN